MVAEIIIPEHLKEISDKELEEICLKSIGTSKYIKKIEKRNKQSGQYLKINSKNKLKYICLSQEEIKSRNSFILQNLPTSYKAYLEEKSDNKTFEYYIRCIEDKLTDYIYFSIKLLLTANIKIINIEDIQEREGKKVKRIDQGFLSFNELRKTRLDISTKKNNNPTLFEEVYNKEKESKEIIVYGKTYGANGREMICLTLAIKGISSLPIKLITVNETTKHEAHIDKTLRFILESLNVEISDDKFELKGNSKTFEAKRNTPKFHYNLLKKYKEKKCLICGCNIESIIVGSHIHRVTDILKDDISEEEKQYQIEDGDNGFWLCSNHDALFERGLIYFKKDSLFFSDALNYKQINFIEKISFFEKDYLLQESRTNEEYKYKIKNSFYNINTEDYLKKHYSRIKTNKSQSTVEWE